MKNQLIRWLGGIELPEEGISLLVYPDMAKIKAKHKYDKLPINGVLITPTERTSTRLG